MMRNKVVSFILCAVLVLASLTYCLTADTVSAVPASVVYPDLELTSRSAVLVEASTGTVLYAMNADEELPPASVTKIMSLLLIMEAIESGRISTDDTVTVTEHAASMGGTQIYLEVGEEMSVNDLIKAIAIPSANDATVAMAEYVAGSESEFVAKMNEKAQELGMTHTHYTCATGLFDDADHYSSARDIATVTRELLKHDKIFEYTTVWMDSLRDGTFGLANTNKMLKTYSGMNGMKTGYTHLAGHCFSGTATRNGMTLVAVVLGGKSSKERFSDTATMLDYGFANYGIVKKTPEIPSSLPVIKGSEPSAPVSVDGCAELLVKKGEEGKIETVLNIPTYLNAPLKAGDKIGEVSFAIGETVLASFDITVKQDVRKAGFTDYFKWLLDSALFR